MPPVFEWSHHYRTSRDCVQVECLGALVGAGRLLTQCPPLHCKWGVGWVLECPPAPGRSLDGGFVRGSHASAPFRKRRTQENLPPSLSSI
eukprot:1003397-Amphidinium_carterae.1